MSWSCSLEDPSPSGSPPCLPVAARFRLKGYLYSEPNNESISANSAHIGVVLEHRLDRERPIAQQDVELKAVLGLPGSHAGREEVCAQAVSHIAQRHGVVKTQR